MTTTIESKPCVRCGRHPQAGELYVCNACFADPGLRAEMTEARSVTNYGDQRRYLVKTYHWAGNWPRIRESSYR